MTIKHGLQKNCTQMQKYTNFECKIQSASVKYGNVMLTMSNFEDIYNDNRRSDQASKLKKKS